MLLVIASCLTAGTASARDVWETVRDAYLYAFPSVLMETKSINDRSDCVYNEDGTPDIVLAHDAPENTANRLPVGEGDFHLFLRIYEPDLDALEGWIPPEVTVSGD